MVMWITIVDQALTCCYVRVRQAFATWPRTYFVVDPTFWGAPYNGDEPRPASAIDPRYAYDSLLSPFFDTRQNQWFPAPPEAPLAANSGGENTAGTPSLSLFRHILFPLFFLSFLGLNQSSSTGSSSASSSIEESSGSNSAAHMGEWKWRFERTFRSNATQHSPFELFSHQILPLANNMYRLIWMATRKPCS